MKPVDSERLRETVRAGRVFPAGIVQVSIDANGAVGALDLQCREELRGEVRGGRARRKEQTQGQGGANGRSGYRRACLHCNHEYQVRRQGRAT